MKKFKWSMWPKWPKWQRKRKDLESKSNLDRRFGEKRFDIQYVSIVDTIVLERTVSIFNMCQ